MRDACLIDTEKYVTNRSFLEQNRCVKKKYVAAASQRNRGHFNVGVGLKQVLTDGSLIPLTDKIRFSGRLHQIAVIGYDEIFHAGACARVLYEELKRNPVLVKRRHGGMDGDKFCQRRAGIEKLI